MKRLAVSGWRLVRVCFGVSPRLLNCFRTSVLFLTANR
jgi:hypothetical protein